VIKSRRIRWVGHVTRMRERRDVYRVLVGKPERKSVLGRPRLRWEDNIEVDLQDVGFGGMDWIDMAQFEVMTNFTNEHQTTKYGEANKSTGRPVIIT